VTASVVVMNSGALAMATDSAVTVPYGSGMKHYQGASKLVSCHADAPVAVLWHGSPDYLGIPWEVIIKDFRHRDKTKRARITDYADAFFQHLDSEWHTSTWKGKAPAASVLAVDLLEHAEKSLARAPTDRSAAIERSLSEWRKSRQPRRKLLTDATARKKGLLEWLDGELDGIEARTGTLEPDLRKRLRDAAVSGWSHISRREPLHTGLVFAGFGEQDRLPTMCSYLVGVPAESKPRRAKGNNIAISQDVPAAIVPFAQNDQVRLFMEGLHPTLRGFIDEMMVELGERLGGDDPFVGRMGRLLGDHIDDHGRPVVDAVRFLPKADLAEFARTLIGFTAFRLRMSMAAEVVGEPIDVAVVSRAEGVVWVHRNQYFPPQLNPQFFRRYGGIMRADEAN
jgi:hypothetical protein